MLTKSYEETINLGYKLGKLLKQGMIVCLKGDLASGKTTFTKGIGKALGINEIINSPTFNILKIYEGDLTLFHFDAYRLENNDYDLGFDQYEEDGITIVEWPEYYQKYLSDEYLEVYFKYVDENTRDISFIGVGETYEEIAKEMAC